MLSDSGLLLHPQDVVNKPPSLTGTSLAGYKNESHVHDQELQLGYFGGVARPQVQEPGFNVNYIGITFILKANCSNPGEPCQGSSWAASKA